jgi:glutamate-ammonia-ligase adenylyltransferase
VTKVTVGEEQRGHSLRARLARLGFADASAAAHIAVGLPEDWLISLSQVADPDQALVYLHQLLETPGLDQVLNSSTSRERLLGVMGASSALARHLTRYPLDILGHQELSSAELQRDYLGRLSSIAADDVTGIASLEETAAALADLAAATLQVAFESACFRMGEKASGINLAIIGLGKCGGRELNYVSDVDVVFVVGDDTDEAGIARATSIAREVIATCTPLWPVDTALRPEGKHGPLVRTLASHLAYYERWAKTWEFQALLKARPVAGDLALGAAYVDAISPLVWSAADRDGFVPDVQAMRRRVEAQLNPDTARRELKLGPGGLRDVEFAVQLLQLVHGRSDKTIRSPNTLAALRELAAGGYVGREDATQLDQAYRFLRTVEHRLQLQRLRRTHTMPKEESELRLLGRGMGYLKDPVAELQAAWQRHTREVRRLHEKLFYRPLLAAVARIPGSEARLTPEAAVHRLVALGYDAPEQALRHLEALTSGVSRKAAIQRTLLPVMLGWFADAPDPDAGLLAFRQVSEALGTTPWYLRLLRDEGAAAQHMAQLLASSRYATDLLLRAPEAVELLADDAQLQPRPLDALLTEAVTGLRRRHPASSAEESVLPLRALRRRELLRVAAADVLGMLDVEEVGTALANVTEASLAGALTLAQQRVDASSARFAVIAMGRLGGREQGYGSDADVLFVHEAAEGSDEQAAASEALSVATEVRRLLALPAPDPPLDVDADLRPEGRQGPLVRSLSSYIAYYERWSNLWESQALLRARPVAGDLELGERFSQAIAHLRWPEGGLDHAQLREIRRIKARVDTERLPRGADRALHTKLGPGGLADVEWTVQLLQLQHAHAVPTLRTTSTLEALAAAAEAGLVTRPDAAILREAWRYASRVRNAIMLSRGRGSDVIPADVRELDGIARLVGYSPGHSGEFLEDYRRITRRCRAVVERVFYR